MMTYSDYQFNNTYCKYFRERLINYSKPFIKSVLRHLDYLEPWPNSLLSLNCIMSTKGLICQHPKNRRQEAVLSTLHFLRILLVLTRMFYLTGSSTHIWSIVRNLLLIVVLWFSTLISILYESKEIVQIKYQS